MIPDCKAHQVMLDKSVFRQITSNETCWNGWMFALAHKVEILGSLPPNLIQDGAKLGNTRAFSAHWYQTVWHFLSRYSVCRPEKFSIKFFYTCYDTINDGFPLHLLFITYISRDSILQSCVLATGLSSWELYVVIYRSSWPGDQTGSLFLPFDPSSHYVVSISICFSLIVWVELTVYND